MIVPSFYYMGVIVIINSTGAQILAHRPCKRRLLNVYAAAFVCAQRHTGTQSRGDVQQSKHERERGGGKESALSLSLCAGIAGT